MPYRREGTQNWWITVSGVRKSSGTENYEDAKALEERLNHQEWMQKYMNVEPPHSWQEAVVRYLNERRHKASYETMVQRLAWWDKHLGKVTDIRKITRDMIDQLLQKHRTIEPLPASCNTTANKYAIVVSAVLNAACREWAWMESSPKLRRYPEPDHRREYLTVDEWRKLEAELPEHLLLPARFAVATGLRAGKVFRLEWSQIDMRGRSLKTTGNAVKRGNTIPLNETAMSVLRSILAGSVRHLTRVFTYKSEPLNDYGVAWYKAMERAGLGTLRLDRKGNKVKRSWSGDFNWHGFRHTFASWLGQAGAPETAIDQLCGWAEKDTRSIYTHLHVDALRSHSDIIDRTLSAQPENLLVGTSRAA